MSRSTKKRFFKQKILFVGNEVFFFEIFFTKTFARIRLSNTIIFFLDRTADWGGEHLRLPPFLLLGWWHNKFAKLGLAVFLCIGLWEAGRG